MEGGSKGGEEETRSRGTVGAEAGEGEGNDSILNSCLLCAMQLPIPLQTSCWLTLEHPPERSSVPQGNPPGEQGKQRVNTNSDMQLLF